MLPLRQEGGVKGFPMDPVSQGVVGAAFAQTAAKQTTLATVAWYGALGGVASDLDVLFQSSTDPLLLEYHRQFTLTCVYSCRCFLVSWS